MGVNLANLTSIDGCKKEYAAARERGDAAGMQAANDAANNIRRSQGVAEERATVDIASVAAKSGDGNTATNAVTTITPQTPQVTQYSSTGGTSSRPSTSSGSSVAQTTVPNDPWVSGVDDNNETDYSVKITQGIRDGVDAATMQSYVDARWDKILAAGGKLDDYRDDKYFADAAEYIKSLSQPTEATPSKYSSSSASSYDLSGIGTQQIAAQVESQLAGIRGAYKKGMQDYDAQLDTLPERYQAAKNDAAAQSAMAKKNFDEHANATGLNSGASGQAALDASATYRGALAQLGQAQASDAAAIDRAKAQLTAEYEQAIAQAVADGDAAKAELKFNEMLRLQGLLREDERLAYNRAQDALDREERKAQQEYIQSQTEYAKQLEQAERLAQFGNFSGYAKLWGLSEDVVNTMVERYAEAERLTKEEAARQLAAWHAQWGDFSKLKELGVDATLEEQLYAAQMAAMLGETQAATPKQTNYSPRKADDKEDAKPSYDVSQVSKVAQGFYTDLVKYYASNEDRYEAIQRQFDNGGISETDYLWLLDKFGLL